MNLYLISQHENNDYDTYDSAVVVAESAEAARLIHPSGDGWDEFNRHAWATCPEHVKIKYLGKADELLKAEEIICASFNAG